MDGRQAEGGKTFCLFSSGIFFGSENFVDSPLARDIAGTIKEFTVY
jgi:hypothetical protein